MANFVQRTEAPTTDNKYYYANNPFYQSGYGLPNCTCYAWGRFYELSGVYPSLSTGDAENWYGNTGDGYNRGSTPKLGAVICWRRGATGDDSDGAGHVAIVEQINNDGSIVISESGWNAYLWQRSTRDNSNGNWGQNSAYTFQGFIYNPVNFSEGSAEVPVSKKIWDYLLAKIGNPYGVAGVMGNLEAESNLCPYRLQGDFTDGYTTSIDYTARVDSGAVSRYDFVNNGPNGGGYGLAQWTFYTLKEGLYDLWKSGGYSSIGDLYLHLDFLWQTLNTSEFSGVLNVLKNATSIREASDKFLHDFERPADQSTTMEEKRCAMGTAWYNKYINTDPSDPDDPVTPPWNPSTNKRNLPLWLLLMATKRKCI